MPLASRKFGNNRPSWARGLYPFPLPHPHSEHARPVTGLGAAGNWEVGHTLYVTSQLLHVRFQPERVRLVGLGFNKINPDVLWITQGDAELSKKHIIFLY